MVGPVSEKVIILSAADSFLAGSIKDKLNGEGINTVFVHTDINEMQNAMEGTALILFFLSDKPAQTPEILVYLKDMAAECGCGLLMIGDQQDFDAVKRIIPEYIVTEWIRRPLNIGSLLKYVNTYLEENTGEKKKKTILIVDDDFNYMHTVYEWLKDYYHIGMAVNGVQAISYLAKHKADLILLDYEMPVASGPQVLSMLKNDSGTGDIPVMFLTGRSDRDSVLSVVDLSPADYLLKTIDRKALLTKLEEFFR